MDEFLTDDQMAALEGGGSSDFISDEQMAMLESPQQAQTLPDSTGSFLGDTLDALGGGSRGYLRGIADTFGDVADLGASTIASGIRSAQTGDLQWLPSDLVSDTLTGMVDDYAGNLGQQSTAGRIANRGGELTGSTMGILGGAGALKGASLIGRGANLLTTGAKQQAILSALGGSAGQGAVEAGLVDQGGMGQMGVELGTMVAPGVAGGLFNIGKAGLRKLYQGADEASGEVINAIKGTLDDSTVLTRPTGTSSAQALREDRLGELAKLSRTEAGVGVGTAKTELAEISSELADDAAYLSRLKKEAWRPSANTNLDEVHSEIRRVSAKLASAGNAVEVAAPNFADEVVAGSNRVGLPGKAPAPGTLAELAGDAGRANFYTGKTFQVTGAKDAVEKLAGAKAEFSDLAKELQTVFKTGRDVSENAYMDAASKVGARLKQPQAARAFVELADGNPEMLSIGKSSLLQNVFSGTPTSWAKNINKTRGSLQEMFTPSQIAGLEAVATKNRGVVGGAIVANAARSFDNKVMRVGLLGVGAYSGGIGGFVAGAALNKIAKTVAEKPEIMQQAISKAFQSGEFASLLSKKATPQNIKAALESFKIAGRNAIMGVAGDDSKLDTKPNELDNLGLSGREPSTEKKSDVIPEGVADVDLTPKVAPDLVKKVIATESSFNPKAVGPMTKYGTAKGLMQLLDSTGREWHEKLGLEGEYDPFNAEQNQQIGTAYLGWLSDQFNGDEKLALAAYNWGIGNLKNLLKKSKGATFDELKYSLPKETRDYVNKITKA